MPPAPAAAIPPAPRKTLLNWIDIDDGHTHSTVQPNCSAEVRALHAAIALAPEDASRGRPEPLQPPPGLRLAPLG